MSNNTLQALAKQAMKHDLWPEGVGAPDIQTINGRNGRFAVLKLPDELFVSGGGQEQVLAQLKAQLAIAEVATEMGGYLVRQYYMEGRGRNARPIHGFQVSVDQQVGERPTVQTDSIEDRLAQVETRLLKTLGMEEYVALAKEVAALSASSRMVILTARLTELAGGSEDNSEAEGEGDGEDIDF